MLFPYIDSWKTEILLMNVFTGTQEYPSARKTNNQTRNANDSYKRTRSWKLSLGWTYYQTTIDRFGRVDSTLVIIHLMWLNSAFESSIDTRPVHTSSKKFKRHAAIIGHFGFVFEDPWSGKSPDCYDAIVFEKLQNVFRQHKTQNRRFQIHPV